MKWYVYLYIAPVALIAAVLAAVSLWLAGNRRGSVKAIKVVVIILLALAGIAFATITTYGLEGWPF